MAELLEPFERQAAEERRNSKLKKGTKQELRPEKFSERDNGKAMDKVASAVGLSRPTLRKIEIIRDAAKEKPERTSSPESDV